MHRLSLRRRWPVALVIAALSIVIAAVFGTVGTGNAATKDQPKNTKAPTISGTAQLDHTLTADPGTWTGTQPITYKYEWQRCDAKGEHCNPINGARSKSYDIRSQDLGNTLQVLVTATNSDGDANKYSDHTSVVTKAQTTTTTPAPTSNGCPSGTGPINVSQLSLPARLLVDGQQVSPSTIPRSPGDITVRFHVSACKGRSVSGALVYATAIPYNQFSIPAETPTGADGWVSMTMHQDNAFPASPRQQLLAVFVRARKPGEPILAGISTRRLVSFPVNLR
jgi:hypothetical protein